MATLTTIPVLERPSTGPNPLRHTAADLTRRALRSSGLFVAGTTLFAFALLGYHPLAEDGGIYAAAAALRLNPSLFPAERAFAVGQTGRSLFVPVVAGAARLLHIPLPATLLLLHILTLAATVAAAMGLAQCLFRTRAARRWAVFTTSVCLGVPVAGTSLYLCDPYLTPRSFTTPLLLLATTALLQRRTRIVLLCLAAAFVLHPVMAAWAAVLFLLLWARRSTRPITTLCAAALGIVASLFLLSLASPAESDAARLAALTREYWFLSRWQWYELAGLLAPPCLLLLLARSRNTAAVQPAFRHLVQAVALAVAVAACTSLLFVHTGSRSLLLARMQPLRMLHPAYLLLFLTLGGWLASIPTFSRKHWPAAAFALTAAAALVSLQRSTYPNSNTFELPGRPSTNGWVQAFQWGGRNTPLNALFALDAHYTTSPGEDAQFFRAIALRSQLPDAAKDGGISSMVTPLAAHWATATTAQTSLNTATDDERLHRLRPLGATWIVLPSTSTTHFPCPYSNTAAKICKLLETPR